MAIDRTQARRRVRTITGWAAAGAAALTGGLAFGASRSDHVAQSSSPAPAPSTPQQETQPQMPAPDQGFTPPAASSAPPAGMSGGS
jgi:hypothetical protein